jgi:small subunit ribosomal protein S8
MLTRIRNALMAGKSDVSFPKSKLKVEIVRILKEEGYIEDYAIGEETPVPLVNVKLKYHGARRQRRPVITNISRISKPGRRVYRNRRELPRVLSGTGIAIVTTPKGVMTAAQARRERVGGEVLCYVW